MASQLEATWESPPQSGELKRLKAYVDFPPINRGQTPVRIVAVESGCGCTTPSVTPMIVPPEGQATLTAVGTPLDSGERSVVITVRTDSKLTPVVRLVLKMITHRVPPFVVEMAGDLGYVSEADLQGSRTLKVTTIEATAQDKFPIIETDLPFLEISGPSVTASPSVSYNPTQRTYEYRVGFRGPPPPGSFSGKIWVVDPWTNRRVKSLLAFHQAKSSILVTPSSISIEAKGDAPTGHAIVAVVTQVDEPGLMIAAEGDAAGVLAVTEVTEARSGRFRKFLVAATIPAGQDARRAQLVVRSAPGEPAEVVVPVVITRGPP